MNPRAVETGEGLSVLTVPKLFHRRVAWETSMSLAESEVVTLTRHVNDSGLGWDKERSSHGP